MSDKELEITGSGGGKSGGGGGGAVEAANTLRSAATVRVVEVLSEGEIVGIAGGAEGIYFNDTPLMQSDGVTPNFARAAWDYRVGLPNQDYMKGFAEVEAEVSVATAVTTASAVTKTTSASTVDSVKVTVSLPQGLYSQNTTNGNMDGTTVSFTIDKKLTSSGSWLSAQTFTIDGKTTASYERQYRIDRPAGAGTWDIRVSRVTADSASSALRNATTFARITEITEVKDETTEYNNTAVVGLAIDAESVGNSIPRRSYLVKGIKVQIPNNYNPVTRLYTGTWAGTFTTAWTDNPAWILYDLITNARYGLGEFITAAQVDKYSFYDAAVYNDADILYDGSGVYVSGGVPFVKDGVTSYEPRFTFNAVINDRSEAYRLLQMVAGAMRGSLVYFNGLITLLQDRPSSAVRLVTKANVIDGMFNYKSTGLFERHTAFNVTFNDRTDRHLQRVSTIDASTTSGAMQTQLQAAEDKFGYNPTDIAAFGATTEGQAIRQGRWALDTELNQTEIAQWKMSLEHFDLMVGDIVKVYDEDYAANVGGGRIVSVSGTTVVLDRAVTLSTGSKIEVLLADGVTLEERNIVQTSGSLSTVTVASAFSQAVLEGAEFILTTTIAPRQFKVLSLKQEEANIIGVEAVYHDPNKYARVELNVNLPSPIFSNTARATTSVPTNLSFRESTVNIDNTLRRNLLISWGYPATGAAAYYSIQYRHNSGSWTTVTNHNSISFELINILAGTYDVKVFAHSAYGNQSAAAEGSYTINAANGGVSTLNAPTTLVEQNGGDTAFTGTDLNFKWTNPSSNATVTDATMRDFEVRIIETVGSTTLRTYYVAPVAAGSIQSSSYTFNDNNQDSNNAPRRSIKVEVRIRDTNGNLTSAVQTTFANAAPAAPTSISAVGGIGNIKITYVRPTDADYAGVLLWRSTTSGFTPGSGNFLYDTTDNYISDQVDFGTTYYYKIAAYDTFSRPLDGAGLTISAQFSSSALAGEGIPEVATLPTPAGYTGPKIVYLESDGQLYSYIDGAWEPTIPPVSDVLDGSVTVAKFAAGLRPIEVVATLPTTGNTEGRMVYLTSDDKLYRYNGTAFVSTIPAVDVTGTLTNAQIADLAASKLTGTIATAQIADAALTTAKFASTIKPVEILATLPVTGNVEGRMVYLTTDDKLYRYNGTAFVSSVPSTDITGTLTDSQIAAIAAAKITGTIASAQIADAAVTTAKFASTIKPVEVLATLPVTANVAGRMVFLTTDNKLYRYNGTAYVATIPSTDITGTLTDAQLTAIAAAKITGTVVASQIADATLTTAKFASSIKPVEILATLPGPTHVQGRMVYLTTDNKLYRNDGAGWISTIPSTDITGTLTDAQLGAIAAAKVTGQITSTQITDDAITTPKIAAGAVTASEIAANTITASQIAATTITATQLASGAVTTAKLAAGAVTANELAANSVIAGKIQAGSVTATEIASNAITTQKLVVTGNSLIANPDFATGAFTNWRPWSSPTYQSVILASTAGVPASAPSKYVAKYEWTGVATGISTFAAEKAYNDAGAEKDGFAVTENRQYAASMYAAKTADYAASSFLVTVYFYKSDGTWTTTVSAITPALTTSWAQYSGSFTAPAGALRAWMYVISNNQSAGAVFWTNLYAREKASGDLIVDGAITAAKITSGTITSTQIAADTITAANIAANAITATELNAGAVTTAKIATGAVTANEIAANTITAGKIAVGAITATELAAGAVITSKLVVTGKGAALNSDPAFVDASAWTTLAGTYSIVTLADGKVGTKAARSTAGVSAYVTEATPVPFDPAKLYRVRFWARSGASPNGTLRLAVRVVDSAGVNVTNGPSTYWYLQLNLAPSTTWTEYTGTMGTGGTYAFPSNGVAMAPIALMNVAGTSGYHEVQDFRIEEAIPGSLIVDGAITAAKILAGTITATQIAADTITAANIAANAITATEISAGAVTTLKLATGAVTANEIAANTITAGQIATGAIAADEIAAGAIITSKLAAGAVTANEIATNAVTAVKILAGTITGDKLLANTITATQLAANTITANEIAANAITSSELAANAVIAGKIQAGAISAAEIAAGAITTSKLAVTNNSAINVDPAFQDSSLWVTESGTFTFHTVTDAPVGTRVLRTTANAAVIAVDSNYYPIDITKTYRFRFWARGASANGTLYADLRQYTNNTGTTCATNGGRSPYKPANVAYTTGWTEYSNTYGPADWQAGVKFVRLDWLLNYGGTIGYVEICNPRLTEMATAELIVDGTITAAKIATGTITANELAANSVTAGKILASTIDASKLVANTITAGQIAANTITGDRILAGTITATQVAANSLTADKIDSRNLTIKDGAGTVILSAGVPLTATYADTALRNSAIQIVAGNISGIGTGSGTAVANSSISIAANGALSGAGGGAVTIGGLGYTGDLAATRDLKLIARGNCYVTGNTIGKVAGNTAWDSDVYSASPIAFGCFAQATIPTLGTIIMFGLNSDPTTDGSYTSIDYAMYFTGAGDLYKYESGGGTLIGTYTAGSTGQVIYDGSYIRYMLNGTQVSFTYIGANNTPYYFDSSFHSSTSSLTDVRFMPYGNPSAVSVGNPINSGNITTYIASAAIGDAQIGNLAAGKITAGTIASNVIHAGSLSAVTGTLGSLTVATNGNIKSGQGSYNSGTGFFLGNDSGTPRFSIGNSAGAHMRWDGSNLYINNTTFDAFSNSVPGGNISASGLYGSFLYGSRSMSVSGGKTGYSYAWFLTGSQNCWITGATSSTVNVYGYNDGAANSGTVVGMVRDANGRVTFTSFNFYGSHSASPYSGGGF